MLLALVTVPLYLHRIGDARYGVLAVVWLLLGYFGSFDLGLSRAAANRIARLGKASAEEREQVFWTAFLLNAGLGIVTGVLLFLVGGEVFKLWFKMSTALHVEATVALPWIAAAVPIATVTAALTGTLEGLQRFPTVNAIQSLGTALFQVAPLATAFWISPELQFVIPAAVIARILTTLPLLAAARSALPLTGPPRLHWWRVRELFAYGSWIAVTNVVGPILDVFDRFLIGIVLGAVPVAYYVVPMQLVNRAQIVPGAMSRALFPYLSAIEAAHSKRVAIESVTTLAAVTTPVTILGLLLIWPFLQVWVGNGFSRHAAPVAEILLLGMWINGLAYVPFALLQAQGRPDIVAKFHLMELVPFVVLLWLGLQRFGIVAAAVVWTLRVSADTALLFRAAHLGAKIVKRLVPAAVLVAATGLCAQMLPHAFEAARAYLGAPLLLLSCVWSVATSTHLRGFLLRTLCRLNALQGE